MSLGKKKCGSFTIRNQYDIAASCRREGEEGEPWAMRVSGEWECPLLRAALLICAAGAVVYAAGKCTQALRERRQHSFWRLRAEKRAAVQAEKAAERAEKRAEKAAAAAEKEKHRCAVCADGD